MSGDLVSGRIRAWGLLKCAAAGKLVKRRVHPHRLGRSDRTHQLAKSEESAADSHRERCSQSNDQWSPPRQAYFFATSREHDRGTGAASCRAADRRTLLAAEQAADD